MAMSTPTRLRILGLLRVEGAKTVGDTSMKKGDAPGSISYHLWELDTAGLVENARAVDGDKRKTGGKRGMLLLCLSPQLNLLRLVKAEAADLFSRMAAVTYERTHER